MSLTPVGSIEGTFVQVGTAQPIANAWEELEDRLWLDPDFIGRNAAGGRRIRVIEQSRENVELAAIPFAY